MIPVCIFAKPFIAGQVKTRLARALGPKRAADLAAAMFRDVWRTASPSPGVRPVLATLQPGIECAGDVRSDCPVQVAAEDVLLQGDGDLGARLENIFRQALASAPAAIAVGADTPLLTSVHLQKAVDALATHDAVIGPCLTAGFTFWHSARALAGYFQAFLGARQKPRTQRSAAWKRADSRSRNSIRFLT
ncbi:MAG: TIGR04282 family arsenosugar biosynthesis glycosyltransferase [Bryobacteraceae bacterium]